MGTHKILRLLRKINEFYQLLDFMIGVEENWTVVKKILFNMKLVKVNIRRDIFHICLNN